MTDSPSAPTPAAPAEPLKVRLSRGWSRLPPWARGLLTALGAFAVVEVVLLGVIWLAHRPESTPPVPGEPVFEDTFDRAEVGDRYRQAEPDRGHQAGQWRIRDGRLVGAKIHNAALWLQQELPEKVRIDFDARAETDEGDVKCEVFGDGHTHQSGYILIFGGWRNTVRGIARQDEHGEDRKDDNRCASFDREGRPCLPGHTFRCLRPEPGGGCRPEFRSPCQKRCVEKDVDYHWTIIRDDDDVRWYLDGELLLVYRDADPVRGRYFAFNNWEARTSFDNLKIYDLSR